jgi:hypothetical protein
VSAPLRRAADALDSWLRLGLIVFVIVLNGMWEEAVILRVEFMMLLRWSRDVIRYDLRWMVQEKLRLAARRGTKSTRS